MLTRSDAAREVPALARRLAEDPAAAALYGLARELEGRPARIGTRHADFALSDTPMSDYLPTLPDEKRRPVVSIGQGDADAFGLRIVGVRRATEFDILAEALTALEAQGGMQVDVGAISDGDAAKDGAQVDVGAISDGDAASAALLAAGGGFDALEPDRNAVHAALVAASRRGRTVDGR